MDGYSLSAVNKIFYSPLSNLKMHTNNFLEQWINNALLGLFMEKKHSADKFILGNNTGNKMYIGIAKWVKKRSI